MRLREIFFLPVLMLLLLTTSVAKAESPSAGMRVTEMVVTTKLVKGDPIDAVHRISSASVKALYCFTRLVSERGEEATIKHVWYRNGEKVAEYQLPVKGKRWRTFSRKTVEKGSSGDWKVEALDSDGNVLKSVGFRMN